MSKPKLTVLIIVEVREEYFDMLLRYLWRCLNKTEMNKIRTYFISSLFSNYHIQFFSLEHNPRVEVLCSSIAIALAYKVPWKKVAEWRSSGNKPRIFVFKCQLLTANESEEAGVVGGVRSFIRSIAFVH